MGKKVVTKRTKVTKRSTASNCGCGCLPTPKK